MTTTLSTPERFKELSDPAFWLKIAPALHVGDARLVEAAKAPLDFDAAAIAGFKAALVHEGYIQLPPLDWGIDVASLAAGTSAVVSAGYLPAFAFMFDEPWLMYARLRRLFAAVLDDGFRMMPAFWAWHVDGKREAAGWQPHRDLGHKTLLPDRRPKTLTVWIPISDATPDNGCMYVLPANLDTLYGTPADQQMRFELQDIRALPSKAGGVLAWTQAIMHWGGRARVPVTTPRISISVEFQRGDQPPTYEPLLDAEVSHTPEFRLRLILRQILQYQHMYPLPPDIRQVAEVYSSKPGISDAFAQVMQQG